MHTRTFRARARLLAVATAMLTALGGLAVTASPAQAAAAPSGLEAVHVATKGVALRWDRTGEDAYRVRISTSSTMKTAVDTWDVLGSYHEWTTTDANPSVRAPRLTPGRTYWFQVKSITRGATSDQREDLSGYGKALAVTLPKTGSPELQPVDVSGTQGGPDTLYVSWRSRGPGVKYVLRYSADPSLAVTKWKSITTDAPVATLTGLTPGTTYHLRARVVDTKGTALSPYSASGTTATTPRTGSPGLTVATYNVRKMYSTTDWSKRRKPVADTIRAAAPDVFGLQEATPKTWATNKKKQYADLMALVGKPYALATSGAGSSGTQLGYNTQRLSVLKSGSTVLFELGDAERYAVWAILEDKRTKKSFFAVSTHLEPGTATKALNDVRIKQARGILDLVEQRSGGRPVVVVGDMNSSRSAQPSNGQYQTFTGAGGLVDPVDNAVGSWASGQDATAEHLVDAHFNSANALERKARLTAYPVGTHIDYTYVSPGIRVAIWRMVVKVDTTGSFVGTIPSDHNLVQMRIHLP